MIEIFGTLGPACAKVEILEQMFSEGMTGMRLNMSHAGLKESHGLIRKFHEAARNAGIIPELLIDMQGPELRVGSLLSPVELKEDQEISLEDIIPMPGHILEILREKNRILLDDGKMELMVTAVGSRTTAKVTRGGVLHSRKSLKIVDKYIPGPAITDQDRENIRMAKEYGVTALMQPFVTKGEELQEVREELRKYGLEELRVFAKIENREGMKHIREILPHADMIVIARGDLGNDMPLWELPTAQKELAEACLAEKKPFLIVTQMLASMITNPIPTRAEVSDIFHAVSDGADAVMATNETAVGKHPVEVIRYLKRTADEAERYNNRWKEKGKQYLLINE